MELWIRVQKNKKLKQGICKVDDLFVEEDKEDKWIIRQSCDTLGIYKTEKRALEVLDEISYLMLPVNGESEGINYFANENYMYYEMPKD